MSTAREDPTQPVKFRKLSKFDRKVLGTFFSVPVAAFALWLTMFGGLLIDRGGGVYSVVEAAQNGFVLLPMILLVSAVYAGPLAFAIGLPTWVWLDRIQMARWWAGLLIGGLVGVIGGALFAALADLAARGEVTVDSRYSEFASGFAVFGAIGGMAAWITDRWLGRPAKQNTGRSG